jgi:hypothetical protein
VALVADINRLLKEKEKRLNKTIPNAPAQEDK